jgi:hypothetical protein
MASRLILRTACVLAISLGTAAPSLAQSAAPPPATSAVANEDSRSDMTVVTVAPDGSWGVATESSTSRAIANAIVDCRSRYQHDIGCGHKMTSIRAGWSIAIRCGDSAILAAAYTLRDAEQQAVDRELELRRLYRPQLPPCVRLVSVDPTGTVVSPNVADLLRTVTLRGYDAP